MAENKWIIDGHHYTCPECGNTIAIVVNESDEGFEFCPFCGKRMSGQMAENKMAEVARLFGKKLGEEFAVRGTTNDYLMVFTETGLKVRQAVAYPELFEAAFLRKLLTGEVVIINGRE